MKYPHWVIGSMAASLFLVSSHLSQADDAPQQSEEALYFLVSLQDEAGNHICNGSYIGNNHILTSASCRLSNAIPIPIPTLPISLSSSPVLDPSNHTISASVASEDTELAMQLSNGAPLNQALSDSTAVGVGLFDGSPTHAVFILPTGNSDAIPLLTEGFFVKKDRFPVTGGELIYTSVSVPDEAVAITLADDALLDELLEDSDSRFTLVGKYIQSMWADVTRQEHVVSGDCYDLGAENYKRNLCLVPRDPSACANNQQALGAPVFTTLDDGKQVLVGFKPSASCNFLQLASTFTASSRFPQWANLHALKQQGLEVVAAYEFGVKKKRSHHHLNITFNNISDGQSFELNNFKMSDSHVIAVKKNNCGVLLPSESCNVRLHTKVPAAINYIEQLTFNAQGLKAGIFVALHGFQEHRIAGDKGSTWRVSGWKNRKGNHDGEGKVLYTSAKFSSNPSLIRNEYVDGPATVNVTYRSDGVSPFVVGVENQRRSLFDNPNISSLGNMLPGTNGEWQTHSIVIPQPGTYNIKVGRSALSIFGGTKEDIEISRICIGECAQ
ncbi:MAG: hypothetical protein RPR98_06310 [Bermanella sp.]